MKSCIRANLKSPCGQTFCEQISLNVAIFGQNEDILEKNVFQWMLNSSVANGF